MWEGTLWCFCLIYVRTVVSNQHYCMQHYLRCYKIMTELEEYKYSRKNKGRQGCYFQYFIGTGMETFFREWGCSELKKIWLLKMLVLRCNGSNWLVDVVSLAQGCLYFLHHWEKSANTKEFTAKHIEVPLEILGFQSKFDWFY